MKLLNESDVRMLYEEVMCYMSLTSSLHVVHKPEVTYNFK